MPSHSAISRNTYKGAGVRRRAWYKTSCVRRRFRLAWRVIEFRSRLMDRRYRSINGVVQFLLRGRATNGRPADAGRAFTRQPTHSSDKSSNVER